jgi:hypothetical protein
MTRMFRCKHCGKLFKRNPRIKNSQRYCGQKGCQQARKNAWELLKIKTDERYRERRQGSKKRWRKHRPSHIYQQKYRETHPEYVTHNCEQQKKRNVNGTAMDSYTKIVKTDALFSEGLINPGLYALLPWNKSEMEKIVKTDALMVQLTVLQNIPALSQQQLPVL